METIIVSQTIKGDYATISEAIAAADPGSRIVVEPGIYPESITIDRDLELVGNGATEQVVIESEEAACVFVRTEAAKLSNFTIRGAGERNQYGVCVDKGKSVFHHCAFSAVETSVGVLDGAGPVFDTCLFHDSTGGLVSFSEAVFTLINCMVAGNSGFGLKFGNGADPRIIRTTFLENGYGMLVEDGGKGTLENCQFRSNQTGAVIARQAAPIFKDCTLTDNEKSMWITGRSLCILHRCTVTDNRTGISITNESTANISTTSLENNGAYHMWVENSSLQLQDSKLTNAAVGLYITKTTNSSITGSTFANHEDTALILEQQNDLIIKDSTFTDNHNGVRFQQQATGTIKDCTITATVSTGMAVIENSAPVIASCMVTDGKHTGLYLYQAKGSIKDSKFLNQEYVDAAAKENNETIIENCFFQTTDETFTETYPEAAASSGAEESLASLLAELHAFIGLEQVKNSIADLIDFQTVAREREKAGITAPAAISYHSIFLGRPGTGKTTIARLYSRLLYQLGVLAKGNFVEVDRKDLVGEHIGQTAQKTNKMINKAAGGVLFIDEAYTLIKPESANDFGQEALDTILKRMEDEQSFVVIAAGYPEKMHTFIDANPGLKDRFTHYLLFDDYTPEQLTAILQKLARDKDYRLEPATVEPIQQEFTERYRKRDNTFGNARMVRKFLEAATVNHAKRCARLEESDKTRDVLTTITKQDIEPLLQKSVRATKEAVPVNEERLAELLAELDSFIGLANVKKEVAELVKLIRYYQEEGEDYTGKFAPHLVFTGNPGTGKTTIARLLSEIYEALGILPVGNLVEASRPDLVATHVGQTAVKTAQVLEKAKGSTLFIDEAYALTRQEGSNDFGGEAVDTILKQMEDDRNSFTLIVAGYPEEMEHFLRSNPGLHSRFGRTLVFEDYTPEEMLKIAESMAAKEGFVLAADVREQLSGYFENCYAERDRFFSNGRFVRNVMEALMRQAILRMAAIPKAERSSQKEVTAADMPGFPVDH